MPNYIDQLSSKLHRDSDRRFDPDEYYYSVITPVSDNPAYGDLLSRRLGETIRSAAFTELNAPAPDRFLSAIKDISMNIHFEKCYVFLADLTENGGANAERLIALLTTLRSRLSGGDFVSLILVTGEGEVPPTALSEYVADQYRDAVTFFFNRMAGKEAELEDAVTVALLMLAHKRSDLRGILTRDRIALTAAIDRLPELSTAINALPQVMWISFQNCLFNSREYYIVSNCLYRLVSHPKKADDATLAALADTFMRDRAAGSVLIGGDARLPGMLYDSTYKLIPRLTRDTLREEMFSTLDTYLAARFGGNWKMLLDTSFKVTISLYFSRYPDALIREAAEALYRGAAVYGETDLHTRLRSFLSTYLSRLSEACLRSRTELDETVPAASIGGKDKNEAARVLRESIEKYIRQYIAYTDDCRRIAFWRRVEAYLAAKGEADFAAPCQESRRLYRDFCGIRDQFLVFRPAAEFDTVTLPGLTVAEIVDLCRESGSADPETLDIIGRLITDGDGFMPRIEEPLHAESPVFALRVNPSLILRHESALSFSDNSTYVRAGLLVGKNFYQINGGGQNVR